MFSGRIFLLKFTICLTIVQTGWAQERWPDTGKKTITTDSAPTSQVPSTTPEARSGPPGSNQKLTPAEESLPKLKADAANPFKSLSEFSAIMIGSMRGSTDETHIYRHGNLMRTEMPGVPIYYLTNLATLEGTAIFPKRCVSGTGPHANAFPFIFFHRDATFRREPLGEEVVDGHHCHIERIIRTTPEGGIARIKLWEADDLKGFPVKVEMDLGPRVNTITYKNVKLEPPDPAFFKRPARCTTLSR